jgi:DNA modification methylase
MTVTVLEGHVLDVLASLPAQHFHAAVTSPPYWQARRYGCPPVVWPDPEGAPPCPGDAHQWTDATVRHTQHADDGSAGGLQHTSPGSVGHRGEHPGARCVRCGAWCGELGQEPEVGLYVAHLVACMRAVRRVLRRDGCLWVNLAGCYFSDPGGQNGASFRAGGFRGISNKAVTANRHVGRRERTRSRDGWLKPLDYVDVPGLFARAMQADGWRWRADVTWVKGSPLPESVAGTRWERCRRTPAWPPGGQRAPAARDTPHTDPADQVGRSTGGGQPAWEACPWPPGCPRCAGNEGYVLRRGSGRPTKATEAVLLFVRRPGYFYDLEAERVRLRASTLGRLGQDLAGQAGSAYAGATAGRSGAPGRPVGDPTAGRNLWDWWAINAEPLAEAHFAAYPTALAARCIRLATSERGCCPRCGAPWARIVARRFVPQADVRDPGRLAKAGIKGLAAECGWEAVPRGTVDSATLGWRPTCRCPDAAGLAPCRVLDPFGGSGRTGIAADRLGRDCTLVELQPEYVAMAARRVSADAPLLTEVAVVGPPGPEETGT